MNLPLLRKRYNIFIILLILLSSLYGKVAKATPTCPIIAQSFSSSPDGTLIDATATGWYLDSSNLKAPHPKDYYFAVNSHRLTSTNLGGVGILRPIARGPMRHSTLPAPQE